ncbi:hypothetical protein GF345_05505 [Candidatus Woesearchaeota archaeon]|nr:hypothetical protein [Candidatus Woesearchaeota archaeon]
MKHTLRATLLIVALFLIAQLVGLITINQHIMVFEDVETGIITIDHPDTVLGPPPEVENKSASFVIIGVMVLIGTAILLLMIKLRVYRVWKAWFFLAVWATMAVAFGVYIDWAVAALLALGLGMWKIYRPNVWIYNLTEVFIYTGIALLIIPLLNLFAAFGLLILISLYDMYAVWKSKHMIKMAEFQTKSKVFAGLFVPYKHDGDISAAVQTKKAKQEKQSKKQSKKQGKKTRSAILGGGDIAFPLLFSGTVMEHLIIMEGLSKPRALSLTGIIAVTTTIALFLLLAKAEDKKFYPAMPFLSLGCLAGFIIVVLLI